MKSRPQMLVALKAAFLENYLAVSAWILDGSSMECHKKKRQPFSLSGVRFGSQTILISGWKSARHWSSRKGAFHPCLLLITCSNSQRKTHQIAQIRHFKPQKWQYTTTEVDLFILSFNIDITRYQFTILRLFNIPLPFHMGVPLVSKCLTGGEGVMEWNCATTTTCKIIFSKFKKVSFDSC